MIDVAALVFDDENEAKFASHQVTIAEVLQVFAKWPKYYVNHAGTRASHVMIGPTRTGRNLVIPIEPLEFDDLWRPVTAFEARPGELSRYRKGNR